MQVAVFVSPLSVVLAAAIGCHNSPLPMPQQPTQYLGIVSVGMMPAGESRRIQRLYHEVGLCTGRRDVALPDLRFFIMTSDTIPRWILDYPGAPTQGANVGSMVFMSMKAWPCDSCMRHELTHAALASEDTRGHPETYFNAKCRNEW